ncbi:tRNA pseudouridine(13) synthase TruD [Streptomyces sp. NPDC056661]|uniref:tRNA pseudouridine(13) synthase TruD n=1 Tax=Streptomyces sp. NPDC056661 TaxID=3345898 RepID=UPI0036899248
MTGPVLKYQPADFVVRESLLVPMTDRDSAEQRYLLLRKCGFTTMEAVRLIADRFGLLSTEISYGGLKDEDGITEQLIAMPSHSLPPATEVGRWVISADGDRWMELQHYGWGCDPLQIGRLEGNGFRVVVRNLTSDSADRLSGERKLTTFFLNYYDTQRFGVPGGPKRTHLVGEAILDGRWAVALRELSGLRAPESASASAWSGDPKDYFANLDPRTTSFYLAAHSSAQWNKLMVAQVDESCGTEQETVTVDGIDYRYVTSPKATTRVLADSVMLPFTKYRFVEGVPVSSASQRTTVVQTAVSVGQIAEDPAHNGRFCVELRFFLPSGCYATAAIRQLLFYR